MQHPRSGQVPLSTSIPSTSCLAPVFPAFSLLSLQLRFRFHAPVVTAAFAVNTLLLPAICERFYGEQPLRRCHLMGLLRAFLRGVLLPLACCYAFESHSRGLFLRGAAGAAGAAASAEPGTRQRGAGRRRTRS
jgi:hypothetical protein